MDVKKIFVILITVVMCVIIGAFLLNVLLPNAVAQVVNAVEKSIYSATHISFDLNGDGVGGEDSDWTMDAPVDGSDDAALNQGGNVEGWE